ncbi:integrase [Candidatus Margulisiibacteriota bacterium]
MQKIVKNIWLATGQICSKRLAAAIQYWLPFYEQEYGPVDAVDKAKVLDIKPATIDRKLKKVRARYKIKGLCTTKPGSILKSQIPVKTNHWDVSQPGFMEADTVAHCGGSLEGDFAWSLTLTDIFSQWTENRATWGKGAQGVISAIKDIENVLVFLVLGFDSDNGSEFLNWHLWRYFVEDRPKQPVQFTRSRAYQKNDNAHVEQKNWTHVRELLGYDRFDNPEVIDFMNDLYRNEWSQYQNYFLPTLKLSKKETIDSRTRRKYERTPMTPYHRLLSYENFPNETKNKLRNNYAKLNPFKLKKTIEKKLKIIFAIASVSS